MAIRMSPPGMTRITVRIHSSITARPEGAVAETAETAAEIGRTGLEPIGALSTLRL